MKNTPITELSNEKSKNIDLLNLSDSIETLFSCEHEIFWNSFWDWILDSNFLYNLSKFKTIIDNKNNLEIKWSVILIWAGTSWRICKMIADICNTKRPQEIEIIPILSWWSDALIKAQINAEDNRDNWHNDTEQILKKLNIKNTIIIWVTCWLSSSYVAGALEAGLLLWCENIAVIWFNKLEDTTMVFRHNNSINKIIKLNPILWPEAICWSVRMKWGSATIMILAYLLYDSQNWQVNNIETTKNYLSNIKNQHKLFYNNILKHNLDIFSKWAKTLRNKWRIFYLSKWYASYLCLFDMVECFPTFGAESWQINAFFESGILFFEKFSYDNFKNHYDLSLADFKKNIVFNKNDLYIFSWVDNTSDYISTNFNNQIIKMDLFLNIDDPIIKILLYRSFLSYFSTYSFIQAWKVYWNMMIDVKITNRKLFFRACRIIWEILKIDQDNAIIQLFRTIKKWSNNDFHYNEDNLEKIIETWSTVKNIIAKTIINNYYSNKTNYEIELLLSDEPIIQKIISTLAK